MSDAANKTEGDDKTPPDEQLEEPSTEKDPGEEPKASKPHDPGPDHEAVGIGVAEDTRPEGERT